MKIICIPAFTDNYIWLFHDHNSSRAYVVDPGDSKSVEDALEKYELELAGILVTHHHLDHVGGIEQLLATRNIPVYGSHLSGFSLISHPLSDGDAISLSDEINFATIEVPGHTLDHIAFYSESDQVLFSGDTLFAGGCGRIFEGTAEQMFTSLNKLAGLPDSTQVFCAHEYTLQNLKFALAVEPDNSDLRLRFENTSAARANNLATVPTTLALELKTNPFLRTFEADVVTQAKNRTRLPNLSPVEVFAEIRSWKDTF